MAKPIEITVLKEQLPGVKVGDEITVASETETEFVLTVGAEEVEAPGEKTEAGEDEMPAALAGII